MQQLFEYVYTESGNGLIAVSNHCNIGMSSELSTGCEISIFIQLLQTSHGNRNYLIH